MLSYPPADAVAPITVLTMLGIVPVKAHAGEDTPKEPGHGGSGGFVKPGVNLGKQPPSSMLGSGLQFIAGGGTTLGVPAAIIGAADSVGSKVGGAVNGMAGCKGGNIDGALLKGASLMGVGGTGLAVDATAPPKKVESCQAEPATAGIAAISCCSAGNDGGDGSGNPSGGGCSHDGKVICCPGIGGKGCNGDGNAAAEGPSSIGFGPNAIPGVSGGLGSSETKSIPARPCGAGNSKKSPTPTGAALGTIGEAFATEVGGGSISSTFMGNSFFLSPLLLSTGVSAATAAA